MFIWIDLRHLFLQEESPKLPFDPPPMTITQAVSHDQKREGEIMEACTRHGVMIAPGSVYAPEEFGWFRVTFSLGEDALREGLKRLAAVFVEIELAMPEASTKANVP